VTSPIEGLTRQGYVLRVSHPPARREQLQIAALIIGANHNTPVSAERNALLARMRTFALASLS
jgi:hypothetical protein